MHTNESAENYLETILILSKQLPVVRSVDIAAELNFKKPSISVAMKKLKNSGYILVSPKGYITLTKTGKEIADRIYERHTLLTSWLTRLGVDADTAAKDACRIEHVISSQSFEALRNHVKPFSPDEN
ncbi:MAG TPA: metal-dependent transcriptional regulator [Candidatus Blautia faecavium]|uniref:Metal-dependent transcriptional regulator n=1 Tax=Candidatus Blautia faecavium TaxID=2838487 RepID=A0A9D2LU47_9FIRM|nr:metal-dependent transcriptional regulator [Candidatus Blautia faecavium]